MLAEWTVMTVDVIPLAITGGAVLLVLGLVQLYLGLKAQGRPGVTGERTIIGDTGIVKKASGFRERSIVEIRGELWWCIPARRETQLREGATVRVVDTVDDSMILEVDALE